MDSIIDAEQAVELYTKPSCSGADALFASYLMRLAAEAQSLNVALLLDDNTKLR